MLTFSSAPVYNDITMATLRELRDARALTMQELANLAGVHLQTVWRIENGRGPPEALTRRKLAAALGVAPSEIDWPKGRSKGT
jgi:transcriptional regulator with XRE-family HTH domain